MSELRGYESGAFEPDGEFRTLTDQKNLAVEDILIQLRNVTALEPFRPLHDQHEYPSLDNASEAAAEFGNEYSQLHEDMITYLSPENFNDILANLER